MCVNNLSKVALDSTVDWNWSPNLQSQVRRPYHYTTEPHSLLCIVGDILREHLCGANSGTYENNSEVSTELRSRVVSTFYRRRAEVANEEEDADDDTAYATSKKIKLENAANATGDLPKKTAYT